MVQGYYRDFSHPIKSSKKGTSFQNMLDLEAWVDSRVVDINSSKNDIGKAILNFNSKKGI